ncbi:MAG: hypothetical protein K0R85_924 [Devosia sp.]|jgi:uncharacterized metal-binding protein YceD (DUF177 family)|nr:hypothetical protein [Devosia sp.]
MKHTDAPIIDAVIRVDRLPATGREIEVHPQAEALAALAEQLKLTGIEQFAAKLVATPLRGGIRVLGRLNARIVQPSVVTFEPVTQEIDEPVDRVFLPEPDQAHKATPGSELFIDLEDDDFPDHIDGPEVDLSPLLIETLALAIDPYPRLPGESLDALGVVAPPEDQGPFASLRQLKTGDDK